MRKFIYPICNKKPNRAPVIFGKTFILCWRCSMCILFLFVTTITLEIIKIKVSNKLLIINIVLMIPMILDGSLQYFFCITSNNFRRGITGGLFGFAIANIIYIFT